jgi:hypothetical protein
MFPESSRLSKRGETRNVTRGRGEENSDSLLCVCRLAERSRSQEPSKQTSQPVGGSLVQGAEASCGLSLADRTRRMKRPYSESPSDFFFFGLHQSDPEAFLIDLQS